MNKNIRMWSKNVAIIVAHPDDETLWAGGTILNHPSWKCFIITLCRKNDPDRAPRFYKALEVLNSQGNMADLDDGPDQLPLVAKNVENTILTMLSSKQFDLIISHNPSGEYTKNLRHEEISAAVINLWHAGKISASELWTFAYEDGNRSYLPRPMPKATIHQKLTEQQHMRKYKIITETYGFSRSSWEAGTTPIEETFWQFSNAKEAKQWLNNGGILS
jgi:LmbE family N-acetylglucosaminyl deacetylase